MSRLRNDDNMSIRQTDLFHIHTYRCRHADNVPDESYVIKAVEMGATGIWFTDHSPFPGDRFLVKNYLQDTASLHRGLTYLP